MANMIEKKVILVALNEINFDIVKLYIDAGYSLPNLKKIMLGNLATTTCETDYDLLEPWIQWPSVHTGKTYNEHKIFRLGDIVSKNYDQIFEIVEGLGFSVGAISPMNAKNNLEKPAYFIPDPWTKTKSDPSFMSKAISSALAQAVNDNSQSKLDFATVIKLMIAFVWFVRPMRYKSLAGAALKSRGHPWRKALFLDLFLNEIHLSLLKKKRPNFSTLFLNAGAHIQHHYFFNSKVLTNKKLKNPNWYVDPDLDPVSEALLVYDIIIGELMKLRNTSLIIATGLSQKPYEKLKYYYRLKDHSSFLKLIGVNFEAVFPRMTRDFEVTFSSESDARDAAQIMSSVLVNDKQRLFGEIDNRGKSLFVVLDYPHEVLSSDVLVGAPNLSLSLLEHLVFVAIKNGEHQGRGFAYYSDDLQYFVPPDGSHVAAIHNTILRYFGDERRAANSTDLSN